MTIKNQASNLNAVVNEISNYYDSNYTIADSWIKQGDKEIQIGANSWSNTSKYQDSYNANGYQAVYTQQTGKTLPDRNRALVRRISIQLWMSDKQENLVAHLCTRNLRRRNFIVVLAYMADRHPKLSKRIQTLQHIWHQSLVLLHSRRIVIYRTDTYLCRRKDITYLVLSACTGILVRR